MDDEFDKKLITLFLAEHWRLFENFCFERGEDAEEIYQRLGGEND
ncbi:hypothetical protein [Escherichia coli]|nr:hypothetical protein [Escherichia coli]